MNSPIWASRAMDCGLNDYAPEGKPVHEIVEELASDNEHFAKVFLGKSYLNPKIKLLTSVQFQKLKVQILKMKNK